MKKIAFLFSMLIGLFTTVQAQSGLALTMDDLVAKPGESKTLNVSLTNPGTQIIAVQFTLTLPDGVTLLRTGSNKPALVPGRIGAEYDSDAEEDITSEKSINVGSSNPYTFSIFSTADQIPFAGEEGAIMTITLKVTSEATIGTGDIVLSGIELTEKGASNPTNLSDFTAKYNIYKTYKVTVAANDAAMGTVEGGNDEAMSNSQITVKATANEGYEFVNWKKGDTEVATTAEYTFTVTEDVNLVANFKAKQYTITFDTDGGSDVADLTADYNSTLTKPADPTKTGYNFAGWNPAFPEKMPLNGASLKAQWTPTVYNITYDLKGGALAEGVTNPTTYTIKSEDITLNNPTKTGYTFDGWTGTDYTEKTMAVTIANGSIGDRSFTANWTVNQYTITFDTDGGTAIDPITQNYDTDITAPANPTKTGYTFAGWDKAIPAKMPAENMTIKANWTINQYTMTFKLDNGEQDVVLTQNYQTAITAPTGFAKAGHTFVNWDKEVPATMPATDMTITALWNVNKHTLTFYDQDGTTVLKQETVAYGANLKSLAPIVQDKVLETGTLPFVGWDPELTDDMTMPDNDISFKALFGGEFDVVFIVDGVTVKSGKVEYGTAIEKPADPTKEGYTFTGWSPEVPATMPAQALTFTAQWQINQYTMTFVLGNGENNVTITANYGEALTAPADPTRTGYTFQAWTPAVPATIPAENKTFTAVWTLNYYELAFYANDEIVQKLNVGFDQPITAPEAPAVEGYEFKGWFDANGTAFADFGGKMPANALAFYAKYEVMQFTMTFKAGDVVVSQQTLDYGMPIDTNFEAPDKEGFLWAGWNPEVPETVPAQNMTFEAVYEKFDGLYWNFRQTKTAVADFKANANQWSGTVSKFAYIPKTEGEPLMLGDQELKDTKGLLFKGGASKFRVDINTQLCMNGANLQLTIPGLKKTQRIMVECESAKSDEARSLTVSNAEIESGFELITGAEGIQLNICNVTANGDVTFTTTGGMNIFRIIVEPALLPGSMEEAVAILKEEIQKAMDLLDNAKGAMMGDEDKLAEAIAEAEELIATWENEHKGSIEEMDEATKKLQDAEATFKVVTGIEAIAANKMAGKKVYSISGQKMENGSLRKGLYIVNGKKVVVK